MFLVPEHTAPTFELSGSVSYVAMTGFCYKADTVFVVLAHKLTPTKIVNKMAFYDISFVYR